MYNILNNMFTDFRIFEHTLVTFGRYTIAIS